MDSNEGRDASGPITSHGAPTANPPDQTLPSPEPSSDSWLGRTAPWLLVAAILILLMRFYWHVELETVKTIVIIAIGLSAIIFIHELGHFVVAKWCDVHVQTFSIGFGPALPGCKWKWGETTYMIALLPLGGYVKMVGEGPDSEETGNDPRSFKNKPVWQRMAIISAGVIMNLVTGFALFVFVYMTHGEDRTPSVVGFAEPGSPAYRAGLLAGDMIRQIGNNTDPYFDDLKSIVSTSGDQPLKLVYQAPSNKPVTTEIVPQYFPGVPTPLIGVDPAQELELPPAKYKRILETPYQPDSAAAAASPPFEFGDRIVGLTAPEHPEQVTRLPDDPWRPGWPDFFAYRKRMKELAGRPVTMLVSRGKPGQKETVSIAVPAAYYWRVGLRMRMGKIGALRDDSPAAKAGVQPGDIVKQVEVNDPSHPGQRIRYVSELHDPHTVPKDVKEEELDPVRLPFDLEQWAKQPGADGVVKLSLMRAQEPPKNAHDSHDATQDVVLTLRWQNTSPVGLGLAYDIETTVAGVTPGSPAAKKGIQKDDRITAVGFFTPGAKKEGAEPEAPKPPKKLIDIPADRPNQWAAIFSGLQQSSVRKMVVKIDRLDDPVTLDATKDLSWPSADRGLLFQPDTRLWKARSFGQALGMGTQRTYDFLAQILGNLRAVISDRLSPKNFGGPVMIAKVAYMTASENIYTFLIFMAIISVNLAVMNFLPIPVLDGGHMVFLIYEAIFRRAASERVMTYATIFGIVLLFALMGYVTWLDIFGRTASAGFTRGLYLGM